MDDIIYRLNYNICVMNAVIGARKQSLGQGIYFYTRLAFCSQGGHAWLLGGGGRAWLLQMACIVALCVWGGVRGWSGGSCARSLSVYLQVSRVSLANIIHIHRGATQV